MQARLLGVQPDTVEQVAPLLSDIVAIQPLIDRCTPGAMYPAQMKQVADGLFRDGHFVDACHVYAEVLALEGIIIPTFAFKVASQSGPCLLQTKAMDRLHSGF